MLKKVVLIALPGVAPFEFGVICEVFGIDRSDKLSNHQQSSQTSLPAILQARS